MTPESWKLLGLIFFGTITARAMWDITGWFIKGKRRKGKGRK